MKVVFLLSCCDDKNPNFETHRMRFYCLYSTILVAVCFLLTRADDLMYWKDGIDRVWPRSQETGLFLLVDEVDKFNERFKPRFLTVFKWAISNFNGRDFVPKEGKSLSAHQLALTLKNMKAAQKKKHNSDSEEGKRDKEKAKEWTHSIPGKEYLGRTRVNFKVSHVWADARDDDGDDKQTASGQRRIRTRPEDDGGEL